MKTLDELIAEQGPREWSIPKGTKAVFTEDENGDLIDGDDGEDDP